MGSITRAWIAIALLAIAGFALVSVLGRPESVSFVSSFKCERFSPGSPLDLNFKHCAQLIFRTRSFQVPRKVYLKNEDARDSANQERDLEVSVAEGGLVTAELDEHGRTEALVTLAGDGVVELQPSKGGSKFSEFKVSSEKLRLSITALGITLTTPSDGQFTGFDGIRDSLTGAIRIDESEKGGDRPVYVSVPKISEPVSIRGRKDEVAGWNPISLPAAPSQKPLELATGRFWAEQVSSCALSVNGRPVDMPTAVERLQIDVVKASITKLALHQADSHGYIEVAISGVARSIKQNNKELIEAAISRLLSQPGYQNGLAGLSLVLVIFAAGIFLKRAVEVLAETWLPKG